MKQQYPFLPDAVEVHSLGDRTDIILRKNIEEAEKADGGGKSSTADTVYECDERQFRYAGTVTKEQVTADFDSWWGYGVPEKEPEATIEEQLAAIRETQEVQDKVLAELLLAIVTD